MAGQGWRMLVECLSVGRGITCLRRTNRRSEIGGVGIGAYAHIRRQFKISIGGMEGIEAAGAYCGHAYVMDARSPLIFGVCWAKTRRAVSVVKYRCTHRAHSSQLLMQWISQAGKESIMLGEGNFLARRLSKELRRLLPSPWKGQTS